MRTFQEFMVIAEGMTMKDFKANRRKNKRREASADAKKRGHVGKEWYNSGRTYSPDEAKFGRAKMDDAERSTRHRSSVDPDAEDDNYSADKTKNPKKLRKQKAMGELTTEGKVAWDDKKNPNPSGYTPKEKSDAKRKQLGVDNPDTQSFEKGGPGEKEYARHGNLSAAQEKMKKRGNQPKGKKHEFKKNPFWKKDVGQVRREIMGTNVPKSKESSYPSSVEKAKSRNEELSLGEIKKEEFGNIEEKAPPGDKYERMVKHIKKGYSKDGLTKNEKGIAYATAWKAYKNK